MYSNEFPCPIGTFSNVTGLQSGEECADCLGGYYCPLAGLVEPFDVCTAGYFCSLGANSSTPRDGSSANICPAGNYCPIQSLIPLPCPIGTFSNSSGLASLSECANCTEGYACTQVRLSQPDRECAEGYYCPSGSSQATDIPCPRGHYCELASSHPKPCLSGFYSPIEHAVSDTQCLPCPSGLYCKYPGSSRPTGNCSAGYYCPGGQNISQPSEYLCPVGLFCPGGSSQPLQCQSGTFTGVSGSDICEPCPMGYYCPFGESISICPEGYFCPEGTGIDWSPCPIGTYINITGLSHIDECKSCDGGMYCSELASHSPSGLCSSGHFCVSGVDRPNPVIESFCSNQTGNSSGDTDAVGVGGVCPLGHFCLSGTIFPEACPSGTYTDRVGQSNCLICPAGFFCPPNTSDILSNICPRGYYCPEGTPGVFSFPCPDGTFNNLTKQVKVSSCAPCTPGAYCTGVGLSVPTGSCGPGWYCTINSTTSQPINSDVGGRCGPGFFCPSGSFEPTPCSLGSFCDGEGLASPSGLCSAGHYCNRSAIEPNPSIVTESGGPCPLGHYCLQGTAIPEPCPPGSFLNTTLSHNISDCLECTKELYCSSYGLSAPSGPCDGGYYCPPGQFTPTPSSFICPVGFFCPSMSHQPLRCSPGTFQNTTGQDFCSVCPAGFLCDPSLLVYDPQICPTGYYCPEGTQRSNENPCPVGTYNNVTGIYDAQQCRPCLGSFYCPVLGLSFPTELCSSGYFCVSGAKSSTPDQDGLANECPAGFFCPIGTVTPLPCPSGTFSNRTGLSIRDECQLCNPGEFCGSSGQTTSDGACPPGYYCPQGSSSAFNNSCPRGHFCPVGSSYPVPCPVGTFSPNEFLESGEDCWNCTGGMFCNSTGLTSPTGFCSPGYYCPEGSLSPTRRNCPIGYFCPGGNFVPLSCPSGWYTNSTHASQCDICPPGLYCTPDLVALFNSKPYQPCPAGFYCLSGTGTDWLPCPSGTYSNTTGLSDSDQCTRCDGGKYCAHFNATEVTGDCSPGYYCTLGNVHPNPVRVSLYDCNDTAVPVGSICLRGHYCPLASITPILCPNGTFSNETGLSSCFMCPAGHYCPSGTSDYASNICPVGHYCPEETTHPFQHSCPPGTINDKTRSQSIDSCVQCPAGSYCLSSGLSQTSGLCREGWFCYAGATSASPLDPTQGGSCSRGYYCPEGSPLPTPCDEGFFCSSDGLHSPDGECTPGYYCPTGTNMSAPSNYLCPKGHVCLQGSAYPAACPSGTYLNSSGNSNVTECVACPLGLFCEGNGLSEPTGLCAEGYFCPVGQTSSTPSQFSCPTGHFCVTGSFSPQPCPPGFYQDTPAQSQCLICPQGYFCDPTENNFSPIVYFTEFLCPSGHYCPNGTQYSNQYQCPIGTFSNLTGLGNISECQPCLGGFYCGERGLSFPSTPCSAGYFCRSGAKTSTPLQEREASECPRGKYCPEGSSNPTNCPVGTFSNQTGLQSQSECLICIEGFYCDSLGITSPTGVCSPGYFCQAGSNNSFSRECTAGRYCPEMSVSPERCPQGTYSNSTRLTSIDQCILCIAGMYCQTAGLVEPTGACDGGFYCPVGSVSPREFTCPIGFHCPEGSMYPLECPPGWYSKQSRSSSCVPCPEGFFCLPSSDSNLMSLTTSTYNNNSTILLCPPGYFCPSGTGFNWRSCPSGTFSNQTGLYFEEQCTPCKGGFYCDSTHQSAPTGLCDAGHFCVTGNSVPDPSNITLQVVELFENSTITAICPLKFPEAIGGICPPGTFCIIGSSHPISCPAGTLSSIEGQSVCTECPSGYFCPLGSRDFEFNLCPPGYVCPIGTQFDRNYPCPESTYNPYFGKMSLSDDCLPCSSGMFCDAEGLSSPVGSCSKGFYCRNGSTTPKPLNVSENIGGICPKGYFCPEMSALPIECTPGSYCNVEGLSNPQGPCSLGFFCVLLAISPTPMDNITGGICSAGSYCPEGSSRSIQCPRGHFLEYTGAWHLSECKMCTAGMSCSQLGLSEPDGVCSIGFYCPPGQVSSQPTQYVCWTGHFCPKQSAFPIPCPSGMYQDERNQGNCKICPSGFFCSGPAVSFQLSTCPRGYFCPEGTRYDSEFPCPLGTFSNLTGLQAAFQCAPCTVGNVCDQLALVRPSDICSSGFFCRVGTNQSTPEDSLCPPGHYCPPGTEVPLPCLPGSFSNVSGLSSAGECSPCSAGVFCGRFGLTEPSGPCTEGYYCTSGANASMSIDCPTGHFCPQGIKMPLQCPVGTFSRQLRLRNELECSQCPAGYFCIDPGLTSPSGLCSPGYYCPSGSRSALSEICPSGLRCPQGSPEPIQCPPGTFSEGIGMADCQVCDPGYYCTPVNMSNTLNNRVSCPEGFYCPMGTATDWIPCPIGTYSNLTGLSSGNECSPCDPGMFCDELAATAPTGLCRGGFFCSSGVSIPEPQNVSKCYSDVWESSGFSGTAYPDYLDFPVIGGRCPVGHFCAEGASTPISCPAGTYNDQATQKDCFVCPAGYFCPLLTISFTHNPCPPGYYCPSGSTLAVPCPRGTFSNRSQVVNVTQCVPCSPGMYCENDMLTRPTGFCAPGWYCSVRSFEPMPSPPYGDICKAREFCPEGSSHPLPCSAGYACSEVGLDAPNLPCEPGYYCPEGSGSAQEMICPAGHFCPRESKFPSSCPVGTASILLGISTIIDCLECPSGYYCNSTGLVWPTGPCAARFYCPAGQSTPTLSAFFCPAGHFCPQQSPAPIRCPSGTYQDESGAIDCKICLPSFYCDNGDGPVSFLNNSICPAGFYCPNGTRFASEYPCPLGTFGSLTGLSSPEQCNPCLPGHFCGEAGLTEPSGLCYAGYVCEGGSTTPAPSDSPCTEGHYCPLGTLSPLACPRGTYSPDILNMAVEDCLLCPAGRYCFLEGATNETSMPCSGGYICSGGAFSPTPSDNVTGYPCPPGHFCESGALLEIKCLSGSYQPNFSQRKCLACPMGTICPVAGLEAFELCPRGFFCSDVGMVYGESCSVGTYSNLSGLINKSECIPCPRGHHCNVSGLSQPSGLCEPGYLCISNSASSTPVDAINAPCPPGFYCLVGALQPLPCPIGTMGPFDGYSNNNSTQESNSTREGLLFYNEISQCLDNSTPGNSSLPAPGYGLRSINECIPCIGGFYCSHLNLTYPTGPCDPGYYCPHHASISQATPIDFECPLGHFCPIASISPLACPSGTFANTTKSVQCNTCPAGMYCTVGSIEPLTCPPKQYCVQGSSEPMFCPGGTYTDNTTFGLISKEQCIPCVVGHFCAGGKIAGQCAAGYICHQGADVPTPNGNNTLIGQPCPEGFYCLQGSTEPIPCPASLFSVLAGGRQLEDCIPCPPGRVCSEDNPRAIICPVGHFCYDGRPIPCPPGTYSNTPGIEDIGSCLPCEAGYLCPDNGTVSFAHNPCPVGHYCEAGLTDPIRCPRGTNRNETGAGNITDCFPCPAGLICPENGTIHGIPCTLSQSCPEGSITAVPCPPGFYCPEPNVRLPCPPGYFCPESSLLFTKCPQHHYCEPPSHDELYLLQAGAHRPVICPLGYREIPNLGENFTRDSLASTCEECPPGTYANASLSEEEDRFCYPCPPGYYCMNGGSIIGDPDITLVRNVAICPLGHYCPSDITFGSSVPIECLPGTYSNVTGGRSILDCKLCLKGTFSNLPGQQGCSQCSTLTGTGSLEGATECICEGNNRIFQPSSGRCVCRQGFRVYDGRSSDCEPIIYSSCGEDRSRTQTGDCFSDQQWEEYCRESVCRNPELYTGFNRDIGICLCRAQVLNDVCDETCQRDNQDLLQISCSDPPTLIVNDTNGTETSVDYEDMVDIYGMEFLCSARDNKISPIFLVGAEEIGFLGTYETQPAVLLNLIMNASDRNTLPPPSNRRKRQAVTTNTPLGGITDPLACILIGQSLLFQITNTSYPVYDRDNLFNTNLDFDRGLFLALEERQLQTGDITLFVFLFRESGVYAFHLSNNLNKRMYVSVLPTSSQCPELGPFFPTTLSITAQFGISRNNNILREPNWVLIGSMIGGATILMIILVIALLLFRRYGWSVATSYSPKYRKQNQQRILDNFSSKGSTISPQKRLHQMTLLKDKSNDNSSSVGVKDDEFWDYDKQVDLEAFTVTQLYDDLTKQANQIVASIGDHKDEAKALYHKIGHQAETIKGMWVTQLNLKGKSELASPADMREYEELKEEYGAEIQRRKVLSEQFSQVLDTQIRILEGVEERKHDHRVKFDALMNEAQKTMTCIENMQTKSEMTEKTEATIERFQSYVRTMILSMTASLEDHVNYRGVPSVCGRHIGAVLVSTDTGEAITMEQIQNAVLTRNKSLVAKNAVTGFLYPGALTKIRTGTKTLPVPPNHVIDPSTGYVTAIDGNVSYNTKSKKLVFTRGVKDSNEMSDISEPLIPYIPYPLHTETGKPIETGLVPLKRSSELRLGCPMKDPLTGLIVPICAITIHPTSATVLPIGGTHINPATNLPIPISLHSLLMDPITNMPVPILGVTIDPNTGRVLPVGGSVTAATEVSENRKIMLSGVELRDPLSQLLTRSMSAFISDGGALKQCSDGYQNVLDTTELVQEKLCIEGLNELLNLSDTYVTDPGGNKSHEDINILGEKIKLEAICNKLNLVRDSNHANYMKISHEIVMERQHHKDFSNTGGCPGFMEFKSTGQILPLLVGSLMVDEMERVKVPILDYEIGSSTGIVCPLGGMMEACDGEETRPIMIGEKAYDTATGEVATIIGAYRTPDTKVVVPRFQNSFVALQPKKRQIKAEVMQSFQDELAARTSFWRRSGQLLEVIDATFSSIHSGILCEDSSPEENYEAIIEKYQILERETRNLSQILSTEKHRRNGELPGLKSALPHDVSYIFLLNEEVELKTISKLVSDHMRYSEVTQKILNRTKEEMNRHTERLSKLMDNNNPEAMEQVASQHRDKMAYILNSLEHQALSQRKKIISSDSNVKCTRAKSILSAEHAKILLTEPAFRFGDEVGSSKLTKTDLRNGTLDTDHLKSLLIYLAEIIERLASQDSSTANPPPDSLVKEKGRSTSQKSFPAISEVEVVEQKEEKKKKDSNRHVQFIEEESKQQNTDRTRESPFSPKSLAPNVDPAMKDVARQMIEKHAIENLSLENRLQKEESEAIKNMLLKLETRKKKTIEKGKLELEKKLEMTKGDGDHDEHVLKTAEELEKAVKEIEGEGESSFKDLMQELVQKRIRTSNQLKERHLQEASEKEISISQLVDVPAIPENELMKDLRKLQEQEARLLSQIKVQMAEDEEERLSKHMRTRTLQNLKIQKNVEGNNDSEDTVESSSTTTMYSRQSQLKDKLKNRMRARKKSEAFSTDMADQSIIAAAVMEVISKDLVNQSESNEGSISVRGKESDSPSVGSKFSDGEMKLSLKIAQERLKQEMTKEQQQSEQLNIASLKQAMLSNNSAGDLPVINAVTSEEAEEEKKNLFDAQAQEQLDLSLKHRKERSALEQEANERKETILSNLETHTLQQMQEAVQRKEKEYQEKMQNKDHTLPQEASQFITNHQNELAELQENMKVEQDKQKKILSAKIAERRQKKAERIAAEQKLELDKLLSQQKSQREELESQQLKEAEVEMLNQVVKEHKPDEAEAVIYHVLRQRHFRETIQLGAQHDREKELAIDERQADVSSRRQAQRDKLTASQEKTIIKLTTQSSSLSNSELAEKKALIKRDHRKVLANFDKETASLLEAVPSEVAPELDIKYNERVFKLHEKQINELATVMQDHIPEEALIQSYAKEAEQAAIETEKYRKEVIETRERKLAILKKERKSEEERRRKEREQKVKELEAEVERERQKDIKRKEEIREKYELIQQQRLAEQQAACHNNLTQMKGITEEEKEKILAEYAQTMKNLEEKLETQKHHQLSRLEEEIQRRRERKEKMKRKKLKEEEEIAAKAAQEAEKRNLRKVNEDHAHQLQLYLENTTRASSTPAQTNASSVARETGSSLSANEPTLHGNVPAQVVLNTSSSSLYTQLLELEETLRLKLKVKYCPSPISSSNTQTRAFIDLKDAQWECTGELVPLDIDSLKPPEVLIYRFAVLTAQMLQRELDLPKVTIALASSLPLNNYSRNCFRSSFFYSHPQNTLFVRKERIESVGEFMFVVIHCLAHIKTGNLVDDNDPLFLRVFHQAMQLICQDTFLAHMKKIPPSSELLDSRVEGGVDPESHKL